MPPGRLHTSTGFPYLPEKRHLLFRHQSSRFPRDLFGCRLGGDFGLSTSLDRRFQPHGFLRTSMGLSTIIHVCRGTAAYLGVHATPDCRRHFSVTLRASQSPLAAVLQHQVLALSVACVAADSLFGPVLPTDFRRSRGFPRSPASASRLPDTGTSLATLLPLRSRPCSLATCSGLHATPEVPGTLRAPRPPILQHRAPIVVGLFQANRTSVSPGCPGTFSASGTAMVSSVPCGPASSTVAFRLATTCASLWAFHTRHAGVVRRRARFARNP